MASEMIKDLRELTIEEEDELLLGQEGEEAHLVDVQELLGNDQPLEEGHVPQSSPPAEKVVEPSPMNTTMEVHFETDRNGDKSPVQLGPEIGNIVEEIIHDVVGNGDKSPVQSEPNLQWIEKLAHNVSSTHR